MLIYRAPKKNEKHFKFHHSLLWSSTGTLFLWWIILYIAEIVKINMWRNNSHQMELGLNITWLLITVLFIPLCSCCFSCIIDRDILSPGLAMVSGLCCGCCLCNIPDYEDEFPPRMSLYLHQHLSDDTPHDDTTPRLTIDTSPFPLQQIGLVTRLDDTTHDDTHDDTTLRLTIDDTTHDDTPNDLCDDTPGLRNAIGACPLVVFFFSTGFVIINIVPVVLYFLIYSIRVVAFYSFIVTAFVLFIFVVTAVDFERKKDKQAMVVERKDKKKQEKAARLVYTEMMRLVKGAYIYPCLPFITLIFITLLTVLFVTIYRTLVSGESAETNIADLFKALIPTIILGSPAIWVGKKLKKYYLEDEAIPKDDKTTQTEKTSPPSTAKPGSKEVEHKGSKRDDNRNDTGAAGRGSRPLKVVAEIHSDPDESYAYSSEADSLITGQQLKSD